MVGRRGLGVADPTCLHFLVRRAAVKNLPINIRIYFARAELRRAGDVSPLILREPYNQGIDIPRSPNQDLHFHRSQNNS